MTRRETFEQVYDRHFKSIFRYVLRRVGDRAEAEDLTAQTFYKALRRYWRVSLTGTDVSSWLYRIATNEVNSHYRRKRVAERSPGTPTCRTAGDAEDRLGIDRLYADLHRALEALEPLDQALIVLRYFEHKPYDEIAGILRRRRGALAMRTHRALKRLKNELHRRGIDHEEFRGILASTERPRPAGGDLPAHAAP